MVTEPIEPGGRRAPGSTVIVIPRSATGPDAADASALQVKMAVAAKNAIRVRIKADHCCLFPGPMLADSERQIS